VTHQSPQNLIVYDPVEESSESIAAILRERFPQYTIHQVESLRESERLLSRILADVFVFDVTSVTHEERLHFFIRAKTADHEPSLIALGTEIPEEELHALYQAGCYRVISRRVGWSYELQSAIRSVIRSRRIATENSLLRCQLTEANMLLEQKNERLNHFAMTLAHDLRAPLAALTMKLQYIQEKEAGGLSERTDDLISSGLASTERLIRFVQSLYEHAKLGAVATTMESCSLESVIGEVVRDLNVADTDTFEITIDSLPDVWGSRPLLYQLFMNLVGNSLKYSDKSEQRISIEAGGIIQRSLGRFFQFEVKDNGPGIPRDARDDIFSLFKRGEKSLPTIEGAGIGLATVKHIVELHGGSVELVEAPETRAESEWGANFRIILPLHPVNIGS